jgi:hypothetical protein
MEQPYNLEQIRGCLLPPTPSGPRRWVKISTRRSLSKARWQPDAVREGTSPLKWRILALRSIDRADQAPSHLVSLWVDHLLDHHLDLSSEIRLCAESLFLRKTGPRRTSMDTLPMSGGQEP